MAREPVTDNVDPTLRQALAREQAAPAEPRAITWRSVGLGLLGIGFICGLTPYNDIALFNSFMVGTYLPAGLLLFFLGFTLLVNTPLQRWCPRYALSGRELAVALCMALTSCGVAAAGLMRYFPYTLVSLPYQAQGNFEYREMLRGLNLPDWLLPTMQSGANAATGGNDPVIRDFIGRVPVAHDTFWEHWCAVPWAAWARPATAWLLFLLAMWGAILCVGVIVRRQWVENERLAFPLASVYLSLVESPEPGKVLNPLLRSRGFWIAFSAVMFVYLMRGMALYFPRQVPVFPLTYDFRPIFADPPLSYLGWFFKFGKIYFCMIGIAYFIQSQIGLSLWFAMVVLQVANMVAGTYSTEISGDAQTDQIFGGGVVYAIMFLWTGRAHWLHVIRRMLGGKPANGEMERYLPLALAGWGLLACCSAMAAWLVVAGMSLGAAMILVLVVMMMYLIIARVVAETGLLFVQTGMLSPTRVWEYFSTWFGGALRVSPRSFFLSGLVNNGMVFDLRESPSVYTSHALRIADDRVDQRSSRGLVGLLLLSFVVAYLVSGASTLYINYSYAATLDQTQATPLNSGSLDMFPKAQMLEPSRKYILQPGTINEAHNRGLHLAVGAGLTGFLGLMRMRFAGWPLHPVGFLLVYSFAISITWLSIFIGWLAKVMLMRFGGVSLYRAARPVFLGLIVGEAGAGAFWLLISLALNAMGITYHRVDVVPY